MPGPEWGEYSQSTLKAWVSHKSKTDQFLSLDMTSTGADGLSISQGRYRDITGRTGGKCSTDNAVLTFITSGCSTAHYYYSRKT